jgi:phenylalanyl-tRNA synthetase alpha chain
LIDRVQQLRDDALSAIATARSDEELESIRVKFVGRRGSLSEVLGGIATLSDAEKRSVGSAANDARRGIEAALRDRRTHIENERLQDLAETEAIDVTFPAPPLQRGHMHVLTRTQGELERVFASIGYHVETGPEIETDWYNFEALNIPKGHPARDNQDSFFFTDDLLLRTQTSPVQIRAMERLGQPPIFVIAPGRTYRRDATDASHLAAFTQLEGLAIDRGLTVADMKGTLLYFVQSMFGGDRRVRLRPDHFPFTEPSFDLSMSCGVCDGKGCRTCGNTGWIEISGCGMVHPQVLRNGGIDPDEYSGFAWGMGIERIAMLKYGVDEIRLFYDNDLRFLAQF